MTTIFETVFLLFDVCVGRMWNGEALLAGMEWGNWDIHFWKYWCREGYEEPCWRAVSGGQLVLRNRLAETA